MRFADLLRRKNWGQLELDLHPLGGGADFGIVITGIFDDRVDDGVGVLGIVMVENQFFGAAFHDDVDGLAPMAVSPAATAGDVFFGKVLRVVDEYVGTVGQFAHGFVKVCIAGLIVRGVNQNAIFGLQTEPHASLRVIQVRRFDLNAVSHVEAAIFDVVKAPGRLHMVEIHGEVRRSHLLGHDLLQAPRPAGGVEDELAVGIVIQRTEKRHALDVVPMKVRYEDMRSEGAVDEFALQRVSQHAEAGAAVEDEDAISQTHLDAGGISPVAQVLGLWSGRGAAHAPKLDSHETPL